MDTDLGLGLPASPRVRGRNRRRPSPPRHAHSAPRLSRKDSPAPDETTRLRLKSELIDFDLIKGCVLLPVVAAAGSFGAAVVVSVD